MRSELEILEVERRIRSRVKKQMEKTSKEYYLNEQMHAIQKELGEKDELKNEIQELEEKLRQKKMPAEAREKCEREIKKLKMMSPMSAEATVVRNYLDWFWRCRGSSTPRTNSTSRKPSACSMKTTTAWKKSNSASSNTSRSRPSAR